jgi:hypothetical protein
LHVDEVIEQVRKCIAKQSGMGVLN